MAFVPAIGPSDLDLPGLRGDLVPAPRQHHPVHRPLQRKLHHARQDEDPRRFAHLDVECQAQYDDLCQLLILYVVGSADRFNGIERLVDDSQDNILISWQKRGDMHKPT